MNRETSCAGARSTVAPIASGRVRRFPWAMKNWRLWMGICGLCAAGSAMADAALRERADRFLGLVNAGYQALYRVESEAQWKASTDVRPEHDAGSEVAGKARAAFNGNPAIIREARELLARLSELTELHVRQLERCLLNEIGRAHV